MEKNFEAKTVGLFGTCGNSKWRDPFIKKLNQLGVTYYNPCRDDWDPEEDSWQLKNDRIILMPVTDETYGTGTLSESAFGIVTTLASIYQKTTKLVIYVAPIVEYDPDDENLNNSVAIKESNRARRIVTEHIKIFGNLPNVYFVKNMEDMLTVTEMLIELCATEDKIREIMK